MTLPAYPNIAYGPTPSSWQKTPYLAPISSPMAAGNMRLRRSPGDNVATIQQVVEMSADDYDTFATFLTTTIFGGVSRFTMPVFMGSAYVTKTVLFTEPPVETYITNDWVSVAMKLRVYDV